jgi:hypothetical protein
VADAAAAVDRIPATSTATRVYARDTPLTKPVSVYDVADDAGVAIRTPSRRSS